ncbi:MULTISPECIES: SDR family oxidoreductase [Niastella]|uniref:SDR family oxidoreductase n=1 Tax=Niastella soli TaxID=2821487 RepID=A0ABS3Z1P3_9BACT|nr:SDR family oxidoreductase [Niastella soli]MBO9203682.1 SDR family oxidoreductase [Niastella soli]
MKTIFITGASTGLGKATAKLFASRGWQVIATMRNPANEKELNGINNITLLPLDVTNPAQIKETTQKAMAMANIDVVFNNAGYGLMGPFEPMTDEQMVRQIETNLLGVMRVTHAFIPYFREKHSGTFITTTSIGGFVAYPFSALYHATKWGLEGWSESMTFELKKIGVTIKTVAPGGIQTDYLSRSAEYTKHPVYDKWVNQLFSKVDPAQFSSAEQVAEVVYEAATDGKDTLRYFAGEDAKALYAQRLQVGDEAFRKGMEQALFAE